MSQPTHQHGDTPKLQIPSFKPMPETSFLNRLINKILAPFFYLIFTIITSIVVVPIYTIIQNFKNGATKGRSSRSGGARFGQDYSSEERYGSAATKGKGERFLDGWGGSYGRNAEGTANSTGRE